MAHNRTPPITFSCLRKCTPSHCPVCRGVYRKEKIKKLHVETTITGRDEITRASSPSVIAEYLQMVAMVSGEGVLDVEVERVSTRVDEWIASLPQNLKLQVSDSFFCFRILCILLPCMDLRSRLSCDSTRVGGQLGDALPRKISCAWMIDQVSCYSPNRSVMHSERSSGVEKCSRTLKRPERNALRPNASWIGSWTMFGVQS